MNLDSPLRSSRVVLTAATIIGCVLLVVSTWSLLRNRVAHQDQHRVSIANEQLQSEFREFYPASDQHADATVRTTVQRNDSVDRAATSRSTVSETSRPMRAVSASSNEVRSSAHWTTIDDVSTVTQSGMTKEVSTVPNVSVPVTINVNNGELLSELIEMRERLNQLQTNQSTTPVVTHSTREMVTNQKYSYEFFSGRKQATAADLVDPASQAVAAASTSTSEPRIRSVASSRESSQRSQSESGFEASLFETARSQPARPSSATRANSQVRKPMRQTQKRTQVEASESQKSVESVREAAEPLHEFGEEIAQPVPDIVPMSHQFVSDGVVESQSTSSDLQSDEVTFFVTAPTSESKSKFVPAPETMPENLPELPQMDSTEAVSDSSGLAFPDSFDAHLSSVEELQAAGVAFSQERLKRIEAYRSLRHLPPEDLFPEAPVNVAQAEQTPYFEIPDTDRDVPQLPVIVVTQSVESENSTGLFSSAAPSSDVPAIPGEFADQHPDLDVSLLSPSDTGIASGAPLDLDNTPADLAPLPPEARFEVASKSPERGPRTEVANGHNDQFSMNSQLYLQSDAMLPNLPRDAVATNDNPQMSHRGTPRTGNYQQSVPRPQNQSKSTATHRPAITQKKPGAGNSFMSTTFRRMKKHVTRVTGPVDLPDFRLPQVDRPDFEWADFHAPDIDMPSFRLPKVPTSQLAKAPTARPQSEESQTPAPRMYVPQLFTTEAHSPDCLCELEVDDEPITFGDSTTVHRVMSTFRFAGKGKALK